MKSDQSSESRTVLSITGMTCSGCVNTLTRVLKKVPGVNEAQVDLASARAVVQGAAGTADLIAAAEGAGFGASVVSALDA